MIFVASREVGKRWICSAYDDSDDNNKIQISQCTQQQIEIDVWTAYIDIRTHTQKGAWRTNTNKMNEKKTKNWKWFCYGEFIMQNQFGNNTGIVNIIG